jgi:hypothetical protein
MVSLGPLFPHVPRVACLPNVALVDFLLQVIQARGLGTPEETKQLVIFPLSHTIGPAVPSAGYAIQKS